MVSLYERAAPLPSKTLSLLLAHDVSAYSWVVNVLSWFFLTLALSVGVPIIGMIIFDFLLWIYRLVFPSIIPATLSARARKRPESSSTASSSSHHRHPITSS